MKMTLLAAAVLVSCAFLGACGDASDRGVEVRPAPSADAEKRPNPNNALTDSVTNN